MSIWKKLFRRPAEKVTPNSYHWGYFTPSKVKQLLDSGVNWSVPRLCKCENSQMRVDCCMWSEDEFKRCFFMLTCCNCGNIQFSAVDVFLHKYIPHPDDRVVEVKYESSNASVK